MARFSLVCMYSYVAALSACGSLPDAKQPTPAECAAGFDGVRLQKTVTPGIVRIESDVATGTGFVLSEETDEILIATNYHVVRNGTHFDAVFDSGTRLGSIEVVRTDEENDLALLKAPAMRSSIGGLTLSAQPAVLAEHIAAVGYPYVEGEVAPSMTFEDGTVTNTATEIEGHTFIRTNANINHGNSGGPVINGCGNVIGVVVAMSSGTERTGLIIPVATLEQLVTAYRAPRKAPETEIAARIGTLEMAVRYGRGYDVASMFSNEALKDWVAPAFAEDIAQSLRNAVQRVNLELAAKPVRVGKRIITDWDALPPDERMEFLARHLDENEKQTVLIALMLSENKIDDQTALLAWLAGFAHELFGENPTFSVDRVAVQGNAARTDVRIENSGFWVFDWIYEWGDWRINAFECVRGCERTASQ